VTREALHWMQADNWFKKVFISFLISVAGFFSTGYILNTDFFVYVLPFENIRNAEVRKIREVVRSYNNMLMDIYASKGSGAYLDSIPTNRNIRHKLFMDQGYLGLNDRVLIYDLAEITIGSVEVSGPFFAEVFTHEEWNYVYKDIALQKNMSEIKGMSADLRYVLRKIEGKWIVVNISPYRGKKDETVS
jgi:hypothetical protein